MLQVKSVAATIDATVYAKLPVKVYLFADDGAVSGKLPSNVELNSRATLRELTTKRRDLSARGCSILLIGARRTRTRPQRPGRLLVGRSAQAAEWLLSSIYRAAAIPVRQPATTRLWRPRAWQMPCWNWATSKGFGSGSASWRLSPSYAKRSRQRVTCSAKLIAISPQSAPPRDLGCACWRERRPATCWVLVDTHERP